MYQYSASTNGFYVPHIHGANVPGDAVEVTDDQYQALMREIEQGKTISVVDGWPVAIERVMSPEQLIDTERSWRDAELRNTEWLVNRHRDEQDMQRPTTLTAEQFSELLIYRQALRDWPQSNLFPSAEQRPIASSWIAEQPL